MAMIMTALLVVFSLATIAVFGMGIYEVVTVDSLPARETIDAGWRFTAIVFCAVPLVWMVIAWVILSAVGEEKS